MMIKNHYGLDMDTGGLILQAQSQKEIYAKKLIAFALRPSQIKNRDLWDILWLEGNGIKPALELIRQKLSDRHRKLNDFLELFQERLKRLDGDSQSSKEFKQEMLRFLPSNQINQTLEQKSLWSFLILTLKDALDKMKNL